MRGLQQQGLRELRPWMCLQLHEHAGQGQANLGVIREGVRTGRRRAGGQACSPPLHDDIVAERCLLLAQGELRLPSSAGTSPLGHCPIAYGARDRHHK